MASGWVKSRGRKTLEGVGIGLFLVFLWGAGFWAGVEAADDPVYAPCFSKHMAEYR